jgi:hypothetical protein
MLAEFRNRPFATVVIASDGSNPIRLNRIGAFLDHLVWIKRRLLCLDHIDNSLITTAVTNSQRELIAPATGWIYKTGVGNALRW